jgi:hypothetical protein
MAIGMKDPVLGASVVAELRANVRNCPPPVELPEAGHFVQEWGMIMAYIAATRIVCRPRGFCLKVGG